MKLLVAASALVLSAGLAAVVPASADPTDPRPDDAPVLEDRPVLPGQEIARFEPATPRVRSGQVDRSSAMRNVARVPLAGAFAADDAYGTDLAFTGHYAIAGNYLGFTVYDIKNPRKPRRVAQVECPGSQNDVSVYRDLLILSVDSLRTNDTCDNESASMGLPVPVPLPGAWEGIRVFDLKNPRKPRFVTSVLTECGSHTHTLAPSRDGKDLFVYVSSYGPSPVLPNCQPPHDSISVVQVPVARPAQARVVSQPVLFPDGGTTDDDYSSDTSGCHDITAFPSKNLAAGACMGDGVLLDITNRAKPRVINRVRDTANFAFWHSATFNNAGTKVVFTDELGGGGAAECNKDVGPRRGADGIYDIVGRKLVFRSYYKLPRVQSDTENCVAHNGSLVPVKGRDIMVQAWYQGGTSVWEFTRSGKPRELQHFDRGAIDDSELVLGGSWSSYWYNGFVYSSDITRGLEVFKIKTPWARKAAQRKLSVFNAQSQPSFNG
ncbi:LVIVD repeat-containing protein [Nocardioides sp.]|uniref:LVIVD repeat-containing protein n=1 Tax=Nocardioides sp. TaxID=35761 RepID=UPI00271BBEFE|nr:hypothetical protein [Nocardioides sp.]MDO9456750.1 hypothetical protein [Nocardioides sp.]